MKDIAFKKAVALKEKPTDESKLGFGKKFTDYMFIMNYDTGLGWHSPRIEPYAPFVMDPATMVLHYGQSIFEGTKCYRRADGGLQLFRPADNFARFNRSADRLSIPAFDEELALEALKKLVAIEADWVPRSKGASLYIRPTIIANDPYLGVRAANSYIFFIILSPSGAYYEKGLSPVGIYVEDEYVRAVRGGLGFAKAAANYAASIKAGDIAKHKGYDQVLWLDGVERKYIEEVGSMNMMFQIGDTVVTPELNGSILPGITRDSILKLARHMGMKAEERRISIEEVVKTARDGSMREAFGTGTAAVISPVGELCYEGEKLVIGGGKIGETAQKFYDTLTGIQYGELADPFGWVVKL